MRRISITTRKKLARLGIANQESGRLVKPANVEFLIIHHQSCAHCHSANLGNTQVKRFLELHAARIDKAFA